MSEVATPPTVGSGRIQALDGLRVASIAGVLLIHVSAWALLWPHTIWPAVLGSIARTSVPAFLLISGYFWARRPRTSADVWRSVTQLLVPYAIWSAVYLAVELPTGLRSVPSIFGATVLVLSGTTAWQLWFLPTLFVCRVLGVWASNNRRRLALLLLGLPGFAFAAMYTSHNAVADVLLHESFVGWAAVFFLGTLLASYKGRSLGRPVVWLVVAACIGVMALRGGAVETGVWVSLGFACARVIAPVVVLVDAAGGGDALGLSHLAGLAPLAFGVYLVHMLPVDVLRLSGPFRTPVGLVQTLAAWLFVAVASAGLAALLTRFRFGRIALGDAGRVTLTGRAVAIGKRGPTAEDAPVPLD